MLISLKKTEREIQPEKEIRFRPTERGGGRKGGLWEKKKGL